MIFMTGQDKKDPNIEWDYYGWMHGKEEWDQYVDGTDKGDDIPECNHVFQIILTGPKGFCKLCNRDGKLRDDGSVEWL